MDNLSLLLPASEQLDSISSIDVVSQLIVIPRYAWIPTRWFFQKLFRLLSLIVPHNLIMILSRNLQITIPVTQLITVLVVVLGLCGLVLRYKYLTRYSKDTRPTLEATANNPKSLQSKRSKPSTLDLIKKNTGSYLDEFLSAIKVFGYLDRCVFHELTKNMTTQRIGKDEILQLDENKGFSIVVEGTLQVFLRIGSSIDSEDDFADEPPENNEDLLIVGNHRYQLLNEVKSGAPLSSLISTLDLFKKQQDSPLFHLVARPKGGKFSGATIALIPKMAFERIQSKYPKDSSHIVAMVLTRLYKVTLATTHNYLGLDKEIIGSEIKLNAEDLPHLPVYLKEGVIEKLKQSQNWSEFPANSRKTMQHQSHLKLNKDSKSSRYVVLDSRSKSSHPGDILSSVPLSRNTSIFKQNEGKANDLKGRKFTSDLEETEESSLRIAITENIFKFCGIEDNEIENSLSGEISVSSSSTALNTLNISQTTDFHYETIPLTFDDPKALKKQRSLEVDFDATKQEFSRYIEFTSYPANTTLIEGNFGQGLYYVIDGTLDTYGMNDQKLYTAKEGGLAGYLTAIFGFKSLFKVKTGNKGAIVAKISRKKFHALTDKYYFMQLQIASKLKSLFSKKFLVIDYAVEWCHIPAGGVLCAQGDQANGFHIVLSGRFRVVETKGEEVQILGEHGHGDSIGEVEVLTASRRTNSLIAVRDSETARIPRSLFEMLCTDNPSIMIKVSRIVANRVLQSKNDVKTIATVSSSSPEFICTDYKTISILPTTQGLPVREFADKLFKALKTIGRKVILLDQASTLIHLGRHAFDESLSRLKLSGYFAYLEEEYETIIYVCDTTIKSDWTTTCILQGDCILLLADADDHDTATNIGDFERLLLKQKTTARTDLCLIHQEAIVESGSTSVWLKNRPWVDGHHHIQMQIVKEFKAEASRTRTLMKKLTDKLNNPMIKKRLEMMKEHALWQIGRTERKSSYIPVRSHKNDFLRLARLLSNEAVGLVLGGGGSRGISHLGVVCALEKHGIPVDIIGGTSIGSFVGGLYAKEYNSVSIIGRCKQFAMRVGSIWRSLFDLTYPVTSYITGYEFNRGIWKTFGSTEIEDFWIKYYCNSTNITNSTMDIHETGYAWRFIRASMSLAGLLPPITFDGCMLLDGGYLDNLPVLEMKKKGAKHIIAVDVGSEDDRTPQNYGDTLSGFWVLFNRWNPFSSQPNVPNMMDIQMRLAYVASVNALEIAKNAPGVVYLRPPIDNYATLDFAKFDEIFHVGLDYADRLFTSWETEGKFSNIAGMEDKKILKGKRKVYRRYSF